MRSLMKKLVAESVDVTLPGRSQQVGNLHPVSRTIARIEAFFGDLGFESQNWSRSPKTDFTTLTR